jgi:hypothetical protein
MRPAPVAPPAPPRDEVAFDFVPMAPIVERMLRAFLREDR